MAHASVAVAYRSSKCFIPLGTVIESCMRPGTYTTGIPLPAGRGLTRVNRLQRWDGAYPMSERPRTDYLLMCVAIRVAWMPISRSIPAGETYIPQK